MPISWNPTTWINSLIEQRFHVAGQAMVGLAKALVAVDTGDLQKSIGYSYDANAKRLTLYASQPYAIHQEFGTYKMRPHPFLRPAINAFAPAFLTGKLTGVSTVAVVGSNLKPNHVPRKIKPHIKPHIIAANLAHDTNATRRANLPPWLQGQHGTHSGSSLLRKGLMVAAGTVIVGGIATAAAMSSLSKQQKRRRKRRR